MTDRDVEQAAGDWLDRLERLPVEAQGDAVHRLRLSLEGKACTLRTHLGSVVDGCCTVCGVDYLGYSRV